MTVEYTRPTIGRIVIYCCQVDSTPTPVPNLNAAIITKVNTDGTVNLRVFHSMGDFIALGIKYSKRKTRGTWHY